MRAHQIPYIVLEAPSNLLLKRFSPSKWQSRIMFSWGIVLMCNAAVKNKGGLFTTRFLLGVVRAFGSSRKVVEISLGRPKIILTIS
jgi:hypothetical protein